MRSTECRSSFTWLWPSSIMSWKQVFSRRHSCKCRPIWMKFDRDLLPRGNASLIVSFANSSPLFFVFWCVSSVDVMRLVTGYVHIFVWKDSSLAKWPINVLKGTLNTAYLMVSRITDFAAESRRIPSLIYALRYVRFAAEFHSGRVEIPGSSAAGQLYDRRLVSFPRRGVIPDCCIFVPSPSAVLARRLVRPTAWNMYLRPRQRYDVGRMA